MSGSARVRTVLFTGYAPVHLVCFEPLYRRLIADASFNVFVSGGIPAKSVAGTTYDEAALYGPLGIPDARVIPVDDLDHRDFDFLFAANTKMIAPRSVGARVQIFHGVSFRNKAVREENASADHYFLAGPYMRRAFARSGVLREDDPRGLSIGFLKTDRLLDGSLSREALLRKYGLDGTRPILLYAPTGQRFNSLETMGVEAIEAIRSNGEFDLLIKPHDHPKDKTVDWFSVLARLENRCTRVIRDADVIPLLFLADLLITDASSVSSEYSLLNRPMIFLDVPKLLERAGRQPDSMLDLDTWGRRCGDVVARPEDLSAAIHHALQSPQRHAEIRRAMAADLFYNPGRSVPAAMAWLSQTVSEVAA